MPLVTNVDAEEVREGNKARDALIRQVGSPVRWLQCVQHLVENGVDTFVEVGPGRILSGFINKIAPRAQTYSVDGIRGIEALASVIPNATM
jgi:[acyl-carrier-protein] S-malonyltransferase